MLGFFILIFFIPKLVFSYDLNSGNYASIKANKVNVRVGPNIHNYPVKFTFHMKDIPIKILNKYDNWKEIEDFEGDRGWVNQNLISSHRTFIVTKNDITNIYSKPKNNAKIISKMKKNVIGNLVTCNDLWCKIKINNIKGWVKRSNIWGD